MSLTLEVKEAAVEFAFQFYNAFLTRHPLKYRNLFYSPFIIFYSLATLLAGAKNETRKQLSRMLRISDFDTDPSCLHELSQYKERLLKSNRNYIFYGNFFYIDSQVECLPSFKRLLREMFEMKPKKIGFSQMKREDIAKLINKDMMEATENAVDEVIEAEFLVKDIKLMIVSAAFFRGYWTLEFDSVFKSGHNFATVSKDGTTKMVPVTMMKVTGKFNFFQSVECDCKVLQMPYEACDLSMLYVLPNKVVTGIDILKGINRSILASLIESMKLELVEAFIPKFGLDPNNIPIKGTLQQIGAKDLFDIEKVNLSGISATPGFHMDRLVHKAFIIVDERGSTVSASSTDLKNTTTKVPVNTFHADHPFVFMIIDEKTGIIIFMGFFGDPMETLEVYTEADLTEAEVKQLLSSVHI